MRIRANRQVTIERKMTTADAIYGNDVVTWVALSFEPGSPAVAEKYWVELQDTMPSRDEAIRQGLALGRNQTRMRMRWRDDVDSSMRVTVHGDTDTVYQIIGGPAEIGGRKAYLELVLEKYSS